MLDGITGNNLEKKLKTFERCRLPHTFLENTTGKLSLDFYSFGSHVHSIFRDQDLL